VLSLAVFFGIVAFLLVTLSDRHRRWRLSACFACGIAVGLVAASRIYLDMHWLSDVLGGFALGTAYLLIAICLAQSTGARAAPHPAVAATAPVEALPAA
jgi:membrane-associated phospholipid phosphatase